MIGSSAGGLQALSFLLAKLPASYPIPLVIVQHRAKTPRNLLEEVLQEHSAIRIKQADEKEKLEGQTVYIAPPDYHLLIEKDHTFSWSSDEPVNYCRPSADVLFESAAPIYKNNLLAIVLTGTGQDGVEGMRQVKLAGGLTIVQDASDAEFPGMPRACIEAGVARRIYTLKEIQNFLMTLQP